MEPNDKTKRSRPDERWNRRHTYGLRFFAALACWGMWLLMLVGNDRWMNQTDLEKLSGELAAYAWAIVGRLFWLGHCIQNIYLSKE